ECLAPSPRPKVFEAHRIRSECRNAHTLPLQQRVQNQHKTDVEGYRLPVLPPLREAIKCDLLAPSPSTRTLGLERHRKHLEMQQARLPVWTDAIVSTGNYVDTPRCALLSQASR